MDPAQHNLEIISGKTFVFRATWTNPQGAAINLATSIIRMQIRRSKDSTGTYVDLDSAAKGGITKVDATGEFTITIPASETSTFNFVEGVFEIDRVVGTVVDPLIKGRVIVEQGVIR